MKKCLYILFLLAAVNAHAQFNNPHDSVDGQRVYSFVQQMPKFNGDIPKYVDTAYRTPPLDNFQGTINVTCIIDTLGNVTHVTVTNRVDPKKLNDSEKEAIRIVKKMPKWQPGRQLGKAVWVRYEIPIHVGY